MQELLGNTPLNGMEKIWPGRELPDGKYTVAVNAKNINNDTIPVSLKTTAKVTGINIKSDDGALFTDMGEVGFDQISSVGTGDFNSGIKDK